jgi:hypothetical protein
MLQQITVFLPKILCASQEQRAVDMSEVCKLPGFDISVVLGFGNDLQLQTS